MAKNFSQLFRFRLPGWLRTGDGELVARSLSLLVDLYVERVRQGFIARFPTYDADDGRASALRLIGRDRGILRGRAETDAHYAGRLIKWRYPRGHRVRGGAFAAIEQIWEYFGGGLEVYSIDVNGNHFVRSADGAESVTHGETWQWDDTVGWARFWVAIDGVSIAATLTEQDAIALKSLFCKPFSWKPAGTRGEWIAIRFNDDEAKLEPGAPTGDSATYGDATPDLKYERWSWNNDSYGAGLDLQEPSRNYDYYYLSLSPLTNNVYSGDPTNWASYALSAGTPGIFGPGDKTSFPASATLPNGSTYSGDRDSFPVSVRLVDDGDLLP